MNIIYSFNKKGFEAEYWQREIAAASDDDFRFIPFNHDPYLDPSLYIRGQLLDNLYYEKHPGLLRMYADLEKMIDTQGADALLVDNCFPYHPDYLKKLSIYKVIRTSDGPMTAYERDFPYLHAYDHVLYHSPAYSKELSMVEKLTYCGVKKMDFWPFALFDVGYDRTRTEDTILSHERDIDIIFIGAMHLGKMPFLAKIKKAMGKHCRIYGLTNLKKNVYFNVKYGFPGWVKTIPFEQYVSLYQRARIGFNLHNRGNYSVGNARLFDLPGNGVMQISDGGQHLEAFYKVGTEVVGYQDGDDLIDKLRYYLEHDDQRQQIALSGYRRVLKDHRFDSRMRQAGEMIKRGMEYR